MSLIFVNTELKSRKMNFYTHHLKSGKVREAAIRGIESKIKKLSKSNKFCERVPQPLFSVELAPGDIRLKKIKRAHSTV